MGSDLTVCANIVRFFLIVINGFFTVIALTLIGIGGWLVHENDDFSFVTGNSIISGGALLIAAGIVTTLVCIAGIIGAIFKLRPLLFIYAMLILLIVILEIVAAILGFVFQGAIAGVIRDRSLEAIRQYSANPSTGSINDATVAVNVIETTLRCCGYDNGSDWLRYNPNAFTVQPPNCPACVPVVDSKCVIYSNTSLGRGFSTNLTGCRTALLDRIDLFGSVAGGIGLVFGVVEIVGIVLALGLCCCITGAKRDEVV